MDQPQISPALDTMVTKHYSPFEWLTYYKNIWTRMAIARTVDVQTDQIAKAVNKDKPVLRDDESGMVTVAERLELRKISLQSALDTITAINKLIEIPSAEFVQTRWSAEALKVDADMLPKVSETKEPVVQVATHTVLKDFGDVKAGENISVATWTKEQVDQRTAEGVIVPIEALVPATKPADEATKV